MSDPSAFHPSPQQVPNGTDNDSVWAALAHATGLVGFAFIGPLVILLALGPQSPFVRSQAAEALNAHISFLVYSIPCFILVLFLIGIPMLVALGIAGWVFALLGTIATAQGQPYRYPLIFRLVR